jgi:DNA-binding transcriptional MerR regulator
VSKTFTIGTLAREFAVSLRTLRFYESKHLLSPIRTSQGGRAYSEDDRARLETILRGKRLGFTLREIRALIMSPEAQNDLDALPLTLDQMRTQILHLERQSREIESALHFLRTRYGDRAC